LLVFSAPGSSPALCHHYSRNRWRMITLDYLRSLFPLDFLGAPYIEQLRGNIKLTTALSGVTAAVVGVILNLQSGLGCMFYSPMGSGSICSRCL